WARATWPALSNELLVADRDEPVESIHQWMQGPASVLSMCAESREEAVAFLHAALQRLPLPAQQVALARCLVTANPESALALGECASPLLVVLVAPTRSLARRLCDRGHHVYEAYGVDIG